MLFALSKKAGIAMVEWMPKIKTFITMKYMLHNNVINLIHFPLKREILSNDRLASPEVFQSNGVYCSLFVKIRELKKGREFTKNLIQTRNFNCILIVTALLLSISR